MSAKAANARYPTCLERPDLGGRVRVRTKATEAAYRVRVAWLKRRVARLQNTGNDRKGPTVADIARWLVAAAPALRSAAYRQYRAAVQQELRDLWDAKEISLDDVKRISASMILSHDGGQPSPFAPQRGPFRTSAGRAKGIRQTKAIALCNIAGARKTRTGENLADSFKYGHQFGLRSSEWFGASLEGTVLRIPCGKYSVQNGRGIAPYRTLLVQDFDTSELERLATFLRRLQSEMRNANGRGDLVMRRQSRLLRAIRGEVGAPRATLRTARHQFTVNLRKAGYSSEERAVALGHAAADTSDDHYGKPNRGWNGLQRWIELPKELTQRVRPGAKTASKIRNDLPLTRSAAWAAGDLPVPGA